jgi:hypothetical protein
MCVLKVCTQLCTGFFSFVQCELTRLARGVIYIYIYMCVCVCVCVCEHSQWCWQLRRHYRVALSLSLSISLLARGPAYRPRSPEFDSRHYQIFRDVVGLERGPLSLVSTIEELRGKNSSGSGLENREYGRRDPLRWSRETLCPQKLALTSLASGCLSVGIVRPRTKTTELYIYRYFYPGRTSRRPYVGPPFRKTACTLYVQ